MEKKRKLSVVFSLESDLKFDDRNCGSPQAAKTSISTLGALTRSEMVEFHFWRSHWKEEGQGFPNPSPEVKKTNF